MPTNFHYRRLAQQYQQQLKAHAFLTLNRTDITQQLRDISGEETTRIKRQMAAEVERAMLEQGVRCFPSLESTTTGDQVRLFHAGTLFGALVDMIQHPSPDDDPKLGEFLLKLKGKWDWGIDEPPLTP